MAILTVREMLNQANVDVTTVQTFRSDETSAETRRVRFQLENIAAPGGLGTFLAGGKGKGAAPARFIPAGQSDPFAGGRQTAKPSGQSVTIVTAPAKGGGVEWTDETGAHNVYLVGRHGAQGRVIRTLPAPVAAVSAE